MFWKKRLFALIYCSVVLVVILIVSVKGFRSFTGFLCEEPRTELEVIVDTFIKYGNVARKENLPLTSYKRHIDKEVSKITGHSYSANSKTLEKWENDSEFRNKLIHDAVYGGHQYGR